MYSGSQQLVMRAIWRFPMAIIGQIQIFMTCTKPIAGWSETYYASGEALGDIDLKGLTLGLARAELMPQGCQVVATRVSNVAIRGDAIVNYNYTETTGELSALQTDVPWNSLLYRIEAGGQYRRMQHFRGIPDQSISTGTLANNLDATKKAYAKFIDKLTGNNTTANAYLMRVHPKGLDNVPVAITGINFAVPGWVITCAGAHGLAIGNMVKIEGVKSTVPSANGIFQVGSIPSATTFSLAGKGIEDTATYLSGGTVSKYGVIYLPIIRGQFQKFSHKKTGRPFGLTPGRRSKRKS